MRAGVHAFGFLRAVAYWFDPPSPARAAGHQVVTYRFCRGISVVGSRCAHVESHLRAGRSRGVTAFFARFSRHNILSEVVSELRGK